MQRSLRFGVNYVPSRHWWYSWVDWERSSIAEDLHAIAALQMDHIRIHCLWPVFQPNPHYVSETAIARLCDLLDLADAAQLDVQVTVLNGWLSGFVFAPPWQQGRNMFTDPAMIDAEQQLFLALAERIKHHPRFLGFDLGNELGVMQQQGNPATAAEADAWQRGMFEWCSQIAPGKFHVNGVDHVHWFNDFGFSRGGLASTGAATALHTWIGFTDALRRYGAQGVGSLHLAEYCIELAKAYHVDLDRQVWLQEFGTSQEWMPNALIPDWAEQTMSNAATCADLWGYTWWCSHDINPQLSGFAAMEYDLGLLDQRNRPKPVAERIAGLIQSWRVTPPPAQPRPIALLLDNDAFSTQRGQPDWRFASRYMDLVTDGVRPAIVLPDRAADPAYLQARGISELVPAP